MFAQVFVIFSKNQGNFSILTYVKYNHCPIVPTADGIVLYKSVEAFFFLLQWQERGKKQNHCKTNNSVAFRSESKTIILWSIIEFQIIFEFPNFFYHEKVFFFYENIALVCLQYKHKNATSVSGINSTLYWMISIYFISIKRNVI